MQAILRTLILLGATASLLAQNGTILGLDGRLTNSDGPQYFGRRGNAHPDGEIGIGFSYTICNPGTVPIAWFTPMNPNHPMFAFLVVRESNGRFEQISNEGTTYLKHASFPWSNVSTCGGTCQTPGAGSALGINCSDTYDAVTNSNRYFLGPTGEVDPWTGVWNPIGSYFDRGDPDVGPPNNQDGIRSLTTGEGGVFTDLVRNRVTLREQDLLVPGRLFHCVHMVIRGEDGDLHLDNTGYQQMTATFADPTWSFANSGVPYRQGTVLGEWDGATIGSARNGDDDGHFFVASKVTQLSSSTHHYEYAVHNLDNARGGATLRIPLCSISSLANVGVRDPNGDPLDDWTWSRVGEELVFEASANNPLNWNNIYNFWFDCDAAPFAGIVKIDEARPGPGALTVSVVAQIPAGIANVSRLGTGCGTPLPSLSASDLPVIPNPSFHLEVTSTPSSVLFLFYSFSEANMGIGPGGCTGHLDTLSLGTLGVLITDDEGVARIPIPIPNNPALDGVRLYWQAVQVVSGGPFLGCLTVSNGLLTRIGCR